MEYHVGHGKRVGNQVVPAFRACGQSDRPDGTRTWRNWFLAEFARRVGGSEKRGVVRVMPSFPNVQGSRRWPRKGALR
ncbi:hypothetical protein Ssi02_76110 [Sinosporangium siamense]|uniref:Uncharacterized protein n=1 Tax=Sinosporangium siamense TaxID=1367973 RepID=A0A919V9M6_9ACTN|nr:hypothetical protein Ssi02_76110 [Sinosporangium siamense]